MIELNRLGVHPDFEPNPWLAVGLIRVDRGEIVGAVFFDHYAQGGHVVDAHGVAGLDSAVDRPGAGWFLQVLAEGSPGVDDPRIIAPIVEYVGDEDLSLDAALAAGVEAVADRGQMLGLSDEQARERLVWSPRLSPEGSDA